MRIAVLLSHQLHDRNIICSGFAQFLRKRGHDVTILIADRPRFRRLRRSLRLMTMVARESQSQTYRHKATLRRGVSRIEAAIWRRLALRVDLEALACRIEAGVSIPPYIRQALEAARPDLLLWPTMIHLDALENDWVKAAKAMGIPVLGAPASWDTLTTKSGFLVRPDRLIVWGEASRRHAVEQHGFASETVSAPGPPHFVPYEDGPILPGKGVLVAGTSLNYWPEEDRLVSELRTALPDIEVAHRLHPRRRGSWDSDIWAVRRALEPAAVCVAAFSTVVIEAALLGRPSALVGFGAGPQGRVLEHEHYDHMREIANWRDVIVCHDLPDLVHQVKGVLYYLIKVNPERLRRAALAIAHCAPGIHERIALAIEAAR